MNQALTLNAGTEPCPGYRLRRLLGRGTFGEVWEGVTADGAPLAFKFLRCRPDLAVAIEVRSIQMLRQLEHPNLTRVEQVFSSPLGYLVVVMELADRSLLDLLNFRLAEAGKPLPPERVCAYLRQAADALDFLAERRHLLDGRRVAFQHCDVKPSNLLLFSETVKLCDYGLASVLSAFASQRRAGTPEYMAPEVRQGRLSERTDQYALAVSYCALRGGRVPFAKTELVPRDPGQPIEPVLTMLSPEERPAVARALAPRPLDRWPSCAEFMDQLGTLFPPDGKKPRPNRPRGRSGMHRLTPGRP